MRLRLVVPVCLIGVLFVAGCVWRTTTIQTMTPEQAVGTDIRAPLKAFHSDGTITVFARGARVTDEFVLGTGSHYALDLVTSVPVESVPLDSIVGIEAFRPGVNAAATFFGSVLGLAAGAFGTAALMVAIFGSCPTIYTYQSGQEVLEAEAFSYSIAPLLEARDVDRLSAGPDSDGMFRIEVRNEALETHYINHLEILEARHAPGRRAYPNEDGRIVSVGSTVPPIAAQDRDGRLRTAELSLRDDRAFASSEERIRAVTGEDYWDHLELTFPKPENESAALVLRLRNSLLNSVLFYDLMLGSQGAQALEWLGSDVNRIGEAVELGRWFRETMGLRVSVMGPRGWREVARVGDTGPIAWKELAVTVPVPDADELRIRLSFLADGWRLDYAALAAEVERAQVETIPVTRVGRIGAAPDENFRARLLEPDEDYLITTPGTAAYMEFEPSAGISEGGRTFFLSTQGYYTEWIRPDWIRSGEASEGFDPDSETIVELMARWLERKDDFERQFYETRIPVR
jgi:hypothetical protein